MFYLSKFVLGMTLLISLTNSYASENVATDNQLKEIELKISSVAEKRHQYRETIGNLDAQQHKLQEDLVLLHKKIELLKTSIKKNLRSEFMLRHKTPLKMLLENNPHDGTLARILFYNKINNYQAGKIKKYIQLSGQQKNLTHELAKNLNETIELKNAAQKEIGNLQAAYQERSKILQFNHPAAVPLSEIKITTKPKARQQSFDHSLFNPLEKITNTQLHYVQKNRAIIQAPEGSKVFAIKSGEVVFCGWMRGYGIIIIIDHGENLMSLYGHNQTTFKKRGDLVQKGEVISLVGKSGGHEKPGLYFEVRKNGISVSLNKWLKFNG